MRQTDCRGTTVAAGDVDGDGQCEVIFLTNDGVLHVLSGGKGVEKATANPPVPGGAERWEVAMIADFRGHGGESDVLLQATNRTGYRTGKYLAAYTYKATRNEKTTHFRSCVRQNADASTLWRAWLRVGYSLRVA